MKLWFFAGLNVEQAAQALGIATSTSDEDWVYARSWRWLAIDGCTVDRSGEKTPESAG